MRPNRRQFMAGLASMPLASRAASQLSGPAFTPEMFGAKGDGRTNDTEAFAAMSALVNAAGGGTIVLRPTTYIVGRLRRGPERDGVAFAPLDIIRHVNCRQSIVINGNGARLRAAPGLLYGRFDPGSGKPLADPGKLQLTHRGVPYLGM